MIIINDFYLWCPVRSWCWEGPKLLLTSNKHTQGLQEKQAVWSLRSSIKRLLTQEVAHHVSQRSLKKQKLKDKDNKELFVKGRDRAVISCGKCYKPQCIYASSRLSSQEQKEADTYTCGSPLYLLTRRLLLSEKPLHVHHRWKPSTTLLC